MKIVKYECNLCGDVYERKDAFNKLKSFYCVTQSFPTGSKFEVSDINKECDRHICINCIETIKKSGLPNGF